MRRAIEVVPAGWLTADQWAEMWQLSYTDAWTRLRAAVMERRMLRRKYRVARDPVRHKQAARSLWHYKPCRVIQADTREVP